MRRARATATIAPLAIAAFVLGPADAQGPGRLTEHTVQPDEGAAAPAATIDAVAWLAGSWTGKALGGSVEESWTAPSAGTMVGLFKLVRDDEPAMYELQVIAEEEGSLVWKVKHFGADLAAWEEREDFAAFPLVRLDDDAAHFGGLSVHREGPDGLRVYLAMRFGDGSLREEEIVYRRVGATE